MKSLSVVSLILLVLAAAVLVACGGSEATPTALPVPTATRSAEVAGPVVVINSPASNSDFEAGAQVTVNSTSSSGVGIVLVELIVDGRIVQSSPTPNSQPQAQFSILQTWQAVPGQHTLTVRATDARAAIADASILVNVSGAAQPTASQPTSAPSATPIPQTPIPPTSPSTCTLNATFIADVTIPDGTPIAPNSPFLKTWQIKNTGTCDWGAGFNLVFVSGAQMAAPSPSPIPVTPAGTVTNLSLNMVAPAQPGRYQSVWQLQASNGALFGTRMDVVIIVPGPITPTPAPAACSGTPQITSFFANPATIQAGQVTTLNWGQVLNATHVVLQTPQGNSGVATPGQVQVQPNTTTTYALIAYCYNNSVQAQTTVTVQNAPPTPTPPPSTPNQIRDIQVVRSGDNYKVTVNYFWNGDDAPATIRAVGVNASSDPVTNYDQKSILAGFFKFVVLNLSGKGVVTIDVCMVGRSGEELACSSKPAK
jgi:hypothetical protein